jgi:hypothetical protein
LGLGIIHCCIQYWLARHYPLFGHDGLYESGLACVAVAFLACLAPPIHRLVNNSIRRCDAALNGRRGRAAILVMIAVAGAMLLQAWWRRDTLFTKLNDEHSYMIGARMLARGRLWMPPYPAGVADFFDALSMISDRAYASMYFPGTALIYTPGVWLGLPFWITSILVASVTAGFLYLVIEALFGPSRALLAVLMMASLPLFREAALMLMSSIPTMAAVLIMLWAWLKFRRAAAARWAMCIGAAAGFAAITRPLDALCLAAPVGVAIVLQLRSRPRALARSIGIVVLGAAPFLALQVVQNVGVTGSWREFPEAYYNRENLPASPLGFPALEAAKIPVLTCPPKRQWLDTWVLPIFQRHTISNAMRGWYVGRLRQCLESALPNPWLATLIFPAILLLRRNGLAVIFAGLALFLLAYAIYLFSDERFMLPAATALICLVLMGWQALAEARPNSSCLNAMIALSLVAVSVSLWPPLTPIAPLPAGFAVDQRPANALLAQIHSPAVVMFRFDPAVESFHDDPVYNDGVAWPDDALVVRARDLGWEKDRQLFDYYARIQPERVFYIYDPDARARGENPLSPPLGTAAKLAAMHN